jgi:hypothetical protein
MSKWQDVPKSEIEIDGDDINICLEGDKDGNNYCVVKKADMLKLLGMEWISVKDRLPEEGVPVLVCGRPKIGEVPYIVDQIYKGDWMLWGIWNNTSRGYIVTHWMPLPALPEAVCE